MLVEASAEVWQTSQFWDMIKRRIIQRHIDIDHQRKLVVVEYTNVSREDAWYHLRHCPPPGVGFRPYNRPGMTNPWKQWGGRRGGIAYAAPVDNYMYHHAPVMPTLSYLNS